MSENIQSISMGTYTIGDTNELTFIAGPGITIDSPSAGTVRIGTDETVLFSANAGTSAGNLNDSPWNYEKIRFYQTNLQGGACITDIAVTSTYASTGRTFVVASPRGNNEINWDAIRVVMTSGTFTVDKAKSLKFGNWTGTIEYQNGNTAALNSVYKIIGINRISGSNA